MSDAFRGLGIVARAGTFSQGAAAAGIQVALPAIPLWVPANARAELSTLVLASMRLACQEAAGRISDAAPVDSGQLAQSFGSDPASPTGGIEILGQDAEVGINGRVFSSLPHAIVMDQGRRPGQPINRAGIDAIGLWAQRKLGLSADEANHAKWPLHRTSWPTGSKANGTSMKAWRRRGPGSM
jgi:hypothetical protein